MSVNAQRFARVVRSHWTMENQLHWVLDVNFGEDQSRARSGYASENLAILRRWALNLIKTDQQKAKRSLKGRMKAAGCLDVAYEDTIGYAGGLVFNDWTDASPVEEQVIPVVGVQPPYKPGQFFRRELPCLLAVLKVLPPVKVVIVDGYVWLGGVDQPGLGAHLYQALGGRAAVVGVAKTKLQGATLACEVFRGKSTRPLFITAAGMDPEMAAEHVRSMHGSDRFPTLLKRVDDLCRHASAGR